MSNRLIVWAVTAALAGFLFGFDTVVISGAEKTIQELWGLSNALHGLAIGMALWGTVLGSLLGAWPADAIGRKRTLIAIGVLYVVSAIWSGLATDVYSFMVARFIGGLGVGISTVAAPLYISEISPAEKRGRLAGMFQFNIVFGILVAFLSNYLIGNLMGEHGWRWMLAIEAVPALIYTLMCFSLPRSPRWLIGKRGDHDAGAVVLKQLYPAASEDEIAAMVQRIAQASRSTPGESRAADRFWSWRLRVPIMLAFLVAFFNQLSGINAILYFAPRIFELAGLGKSAALLNSIGIGVTNLVFTFVGLYLIDRVGRRTLLYVGSFGYIASLGLCAAVFFTFAPQFLVANTAISLKNSIQSLQQAEAMKVRNSEDVQQLQVQVQQAKQTLVQATTSPAYGGDPIRFPVDASSESSIAMADAAMLQASELAGAGGTLVMLCIFAFIAAHAVGQGAVIWVLISEVFPNQHRAPGQSLGSFSHWIFAALLTTLFPWMIGTFAPAVVFGFFCFMMVLQLIWVATMVPETKGVPLEEMEKKLGIVPVKPLGSKS